MNEKGLVLLHSLYQTSFHNFEVVQNILPKSTLPQLSMELEAQLECHHAICKQIKKNWALPQEHSLPVVKTNSINKLSTFKIFSASEIAAKIIEETNQSNLKIYQLLTPESNPITLIEKEAEAIMRQRKQHIHNLRYYL